MRHCGVIHNENITKNGENPNGKTPCQLAMRGVTTMDKKELHKLISYFVMGDGGVYYSGQECRFVMNMLEKNEDYVLWAKTVLDNVTGTAIRKVKDERDGRHSILSLSTKTHPVFTKMREQIYTDNYKGLSPHYLKMLDWESLAILYMSDGGLYIDKPNPKRGLVNPSYSISLYMKRLSYGDQLLLKNSLKRLGTEWNINRAGKYFCLRLRSKDNRVFSENTAPYMLSSFSYKIIPEFRK